jgi:hypothetical protein
VQSVLQIQKEALGERYLAIWGFRQQLGEPCVANMPSYAISSSLILVIHDNMIIGTNLIVLACLCRHF